MLLLLLAATAALTLLLVKMWPDSWKDVPMPLAWHPFLGNSLEMFANREDIFEVLWKVTAKVGQVSWGVSLPGQRMLMLVSPQNVAHMLKKNFENYVKGTGTQESFEELLGDGIFTSDGNQWRSHRKAASHMFSLRRLSNHAMASFTEYAKVVVSVLDAKGAEEGFDLQSIFYGYTFDAFSNIAFGQHLNSIVEPHVFPKSFQRLNTICVTRLFIPGLWKLLRLLGVAYESPLKTEETILNKHVEDVIVSRLGDSKEDADGPEGAFGNDLLGLFMEAFEKREGRKPSKKTLRDVVMNFLIAGMDTTAWTLTAMIMCMHDHPEAARKVIAEVDDLMQGNELSPTYADLASYQYLEAFMLETLRLYPSVPLQFKFSVTDDVMPADNTVVKKGDMVIYSSYILGRLQSVWGDDALEFKPERWLEMDKFKVDDCKYPIFNVGKRNCLGKPMAIMEVKLLLATLLKRYTIDVVPSQKKAFCLGATLKLRDGLRVTVKRR